MLEEFLNNKAAGLLVMSQPASKKENQEGKEDGLATTITDSPVMVEYNLEEIPNEKQPLPIVKGCFIATAAMGSDLHPYVQSLREFRDNILLQSRYKGKFESLLDKYYLLSPPIARAMERNLYLKVFLRYSLVYPTVFTIKIVLPIFDAVLGIGKDAKRTTEEKRLTI
jgi:hypothetical protein